MGINKHLKHSVDIVYIVMTRGVRAETTVTGVPAFITQRTMVLKDESGDHFGVQNLVFLKGDVTLSEIDEIIFDGKQRPIIGIFKVRTKSNAIHHLEVAVQ